jgi:molecular chaperone Hsp33
LGEIVLNKSRLLSFIDKNNEFTLHFIEGQKLVHDLAMIHNLKGKGFAYFRDSILSAIPLITLLKFNENLGLYIDNEDPYFLLKIEMSESGEFRTLLLPETFSEFPDKLDGKARLTKITVGKPNPYTSIINLDNLNFHEVVNQVFKESYQIKAEVTVSQVADQSVLIMQLPRKNWDKEENTQPQRELAEFKRDITKDIENLFNQGINDEKEVISALEDAGLTYLTGKDLDFKCNCSYERMVSGVESLLRSHSLDEIFKDDKSLEIRCDYCKTYYQVPKDQFLKN